MFITIKGEPGKGVGCVVKCAALKPLENPNNRGFLVDTASEFVPFARENDAQILTAEKELRMEASNLPNPKIWFQSMKRNGIFTGLPPLKKNPILIKRKVDKTENVIILGTAGEGMNFYSKTLQVDQMLGNGLK